MTSFGALFVAESAPHACHSAFIAKHTVTCARRCSSLHRLNTKYDVSQATVQDIRLMSDSLSQGARRENLISHLSGEGARNDRGTV